jgi:uncharacterized protein YoxC
VTNAAALIASLAFVALVVTLIVVLLQLMRTARAAEQTLAAVEREVRPLADQVQALLQEHRGLAHQATRDLRRVEGVVVGAQEVVSRLSRATGFLGGLGTVGQVLGVAQGLRRGADVFLQRLVRRR